MSETKRIFTEMLADDFDNPNFLRQLSEGTEIDYNEARSRTIDDDLISEPFERYAFGHERYFLSQSRFYETAKENELDVSIARCESNGYPIAILNQGRFHFTFHYGFTPQEITCIKTSLVRRQNSAINSKVTQGSLFDIVEFDPNKLQDADNIYANIIHGCGGNGLSFGEHGFLRIAVPYVEKNAKGKDQFRFIENVDLFDVLQILVDNESKETQAKPMVDVALPKVKTRKQGA